MKIGIDLDEVLGPFTEPFMNFHNKKYGTRILLNQVNNYDFHSLLGITEEESIGRVYRFYESDEFYSIKPLDGAVEAIETLHEIGHHLELITARPKIMEVKTRNWINKYFPDKFSNIHITNSYALEGTSVKKSEVCKKQNIPLIIDDSPHHAIDCASAGVDAILLNYPWNLNVAMPENVTRVNSWKEIIEILQLK